MLETFLANRDLRVRASVDEKKIHFSSNSKLTNTSTKKVKDEGGYSGRRGMQMDSSAQIDLKELPSKTRNFNG